MNVLSSEKNAYLGACFLGGSNSLVLLKQILGQIVHKQRQGQIEESEVGEGEKMKKEKKHKQRARASERKLSEEQTKKQNMTKNL